MTPSEKRKRLAEIEKTYKTAKHLNGVKVFNDGTCISNTDDLPWLIAELEAAWSLLDTYKDKLWYEQRVTDLKNVNLKYELESAQKQLEKMAEALGYYADDGNWAFTPSDKTNLWKATTILEDSSQCDNLTGGKRARQALSEYNTWKEGK